MVLCGISNDVIFNYLSIYAIKKGKKKGNKEYNIASSV